MQRHLFKTQNMYNDKQFKHNILTTQYFKRESLYGCTELSRKNY